MALLPTHDDVGVDPIAAADPPRASVMETRDASHTLKQSSDALVTSSNALGS